MKKKKAAKIPYEGYTLPPSSEKGGSFVDFNQAYRESKVKVPIKKVKVRKKNDVR
jgi:hypothetical protein